MAGQQSTAAVRVVGHVAWWVFVVVRITEPVATGGMPRRYAEYSPGSGTGWTAYTPLQTGPSGFTDANVLATVAVIALAVTLGAAVVEALLTRAWPASVLTVVTPVLGAALVWVGVDAQYGYVWNNVLLRPMLAVPMILVGVAVREVWSRGYAPAVRRDRPRAAGTDTPD